jgi:hypothetical protein
MRVGSISALRGEVGGRGFSASCLWYRTPPSQYWVLAASLRTPQGSPLKKGPFPPASDTGYRSAVQIRYTTTLPTALIVSMRTTRTSSPRGMLYPPPVPLLDFSGDLTGSARFGWATLLQDVAYGLLQLNLSALPRLPRLPSSPQSEHEQLQPREGVWKAATSEADPRQ